MSKLTTLLETKAKLEYEVQGMDAFLNVVHGKAPLQVVAGDEVLEFEEADLGVELKILAVLKEDYAARAAKLEAVTRKVEALEELVS